MFERPVVEVDDAAACAEALVASVAAQRRAVAVQFARVAAWAHLHSPGHGLPETTPAAERDRQLTRAATEAADGVPPVAPNAAVELGMLLGTSTGSAAGLMRDVQELQHRLPRLWEAVQTGTAEGWRGREVAKLTHQLSLEQAQWVDAQVLEAVVGLPWGRAKNVVEAKIIAVDPEAHRARLALEENRPFVSTRRRSTTTGMRTLIARGPAGDIARLEAMIAHLADLLHRRGDPDPADHRRAKALAMLANPALTCLFLTQHPTTTPATATPPAETTAETTAGTAAESVTGESGAAEVSSGHQPSETPAPDTGDPADPDTQPDTHPGTHPDTQPDTDLEPEPELEPEVGSASAVELAVAFGRVLAGLGARAIDRLRPRSVLYVHLAAEAVHALPGTGVARIEDPLAGGPIDLDQLKSCLGTDRITVKPVIDPTGVEPVDGYEVPHHLREALQLLTPYETFPHGTLTTRQADTDHTIPYRPPDRGGPPGQTSLTNLGPLSRRHHLAKTFDRFTVHQPTHGLYYWRTPTGHWLQVDHRGTRYLGPHRPTALDITDRHPTTHTGANTKVENHLRDLLIRHLAA